VDTGRIAREMRPHPCLVAKDGGDVQVDAHEVGMRRQDGVGALEGPMPPARVDELDARVLR
jgi:hypothetical protein